MNINGFEIHIKPRFYVAVGFLIIASGIVFIYQSKDSFYENKNTQVLAAADTKDANAYDLIPVNSGSKNITSEEKIEDYQPVIISHTVKETETLASIAEKYHADPQTIADFPNNELGESLQLSVGQILIIPNGFIDSGPTPAPLPIAQGSGLFSWPVMGQVSQYAFWWHPGAIDIAAALGTPVTAAYAGKVVTVEKWSTGYGWHVVIDHGTSYSAIYAHLSQIDVSVGQNIQEGERVGLVGSTGRSTGPHLHFEVRHNNSPVDPMTLLHAQ